jgi:short-subunit dehydrogenase
VGNIPSSPFPADQSAEVMVLVNNAGVAGARRPIDELTGAV